MFALFMHLSWRELHMNFVFSSSSYEKCTGTLYETQSHLLSQGHRLAAQIYNCFVADFSV